MFIRLNIPAAVVLGLSLICLPPQTVLADGGVPEVFWGAPAIPQKGSKRSAMSAKEMQEALLWVGFYYGKVNGKVDDATIKAVKRFQTSLDQSTTGKLGPAQISTLRARAARAKKDADFRLVHDDWTGIKAPLPMGYLAAPRLESIKPKEDKYVMVKFPAKGSSNFSVSYARYPNVASTNITGWKNYFEKLVKKRKENKILTSEIVGKYYLLVYVSAGRYLQNSVFNFDRGEARSIIFSYPVSRANIFSPIRKEILSKARFFQSSGLAKPERISRFADRNIPGYEERPDWMRTMYGNGSGSIVSIRGHILTNHHVVDGCSRLTVNGNKAILLGVDIVNDLALLRSDSFSRRDPVRFRDQNTALGEDVIVIGYPKYGISQTLNITSGVVSSLKGIYGDRRTIQITAPIQGGNSGGPVVDTKGQQIAVVVSKAGEGLKGVENMAWVIRSNIAINFLNNLGVKPLMGDDVPESTDTVQKVAGKAKKYTVRIECHR